MNQALGLAGARGSHSVPDSLLCLGPILTLALSMSLAKLVPVTEADATFTASTARRASSVSSQLETPERRVHFLGSASTASCAIDWLCLALCPHQPLSLRARNGMF